MRTYLLYRIGANAYNQPGAFRAPVAIVTAPSREVTEATEIPGGIPRIDTPAVSVLAPHVTCCANQRLEAVPSSRARVSDWNHVVEMEAR